MHTRKWEKDALQIDDLWSFLNFCDSPLPQWVLEFLIVSKQDASIVHCILQGPQFAAKARVVTLDMKNMEMESYMPFTNEYKLVFKDCNLDTRNIFFNTPFISYDFDCLNTEIGKLSPSGLANW
jgi:hypothetical protein